MSRFDLCQLLSATTRGILFMAAGVFLLLHVIGIVKCATSTILLALAIGMIVYGFALTGLHTKLGLK